MPHYDFAPRFRAVYDLAIKKYAAGVRRAEDLFNKEEQAFLTSNGISAQHLYDYAEDDDGDGGEPGLERALSIELVRRDYFLNVQHGRPSGKVLESATLPEKSAAVNGISWLPRIIPKARAKLRGELPASMMYCCGGDRQFLKQHDIAPSEFLSLLWRHEHDDDAIVQWVVKRSRTA